jgi:hypothetical protein
MTIGDSFSEPVLNLLNPPATTSGRCVGLWSRQESNLDLVFRKHLFYPLNYGTIEPPGFEALFSLGLNEGLQK